MMDAENEVAGEHPAWHDHQVVTFDGATGTRPTPMRLIDLIRMPAQQVPREKALAFIPSSFSGPRARKKEAQQSHGSYVSLNADYDGGCEADNPVEVIRRALEEFTQGGPWVAYTTFRATAENPRMRILIPLNEPVEFEVWKAGQAVLSAHLVAAGVPVDNCANRASQLMFAPNSLSGFFKRSIRNEEAKAISLRDPVFADRMAQALKRRADAAPKERAQTGAVAAGVELDSDANTARAEAYLAERKGAAEGNRDNWTYKTACGVIDFGISAEMCFDLLAPWDLEKNVPPLGEELVRIKCDSAWRTRTNLVGSASIEAEFADVKIPPIERARRKWAYRHGDTVSRKMRWLLYRRLPLIGTTMIVGPSGGGKTFFLADLARAIAKGEAFFGETPDECGGVALLVAEGVAGMPGRLSILGDVPLPIWGEPVSNLRSKEEQRRICSLLDDAQAECLDRFGQPLRLIGIDTLAASGLLEDENDNSQCSEAVKLLEQLAMRYDCLVAVTHHPPKSGNGARGGSALHAGFDTVVEIHQDNKQPIRRAECTKSRDAPTGDWGCFKLEPHVIGIDDRGREETTCTLIVSTAGARSAAATFLDPNLVDTIVEAVGDKTWRENEQSSETSIIHVIAKCADLDPDTAFGSRQAKEYLCGLLTIGVLEKGTERIGGKNRPVIFAAKTNGDGETRTARTA